MEKVSIDFVFVRFRSSKIPSSPYNGSLLTSGNFELQQQPQKQSMLGKLKLFGKDKTEVPKTQLSKRTSSSSGFSSARSERSDSSISLNNESNISSSQASSTKSTSKKSDSVKSTSKVPAKKGDKKDKSQTNNCETESNGIEADHVPPTKMHKIPQAKLQVSAVGRKPESVKTGLSSQLQQPKSAQSPSVGTNIPKPMAAIKGTTKQTASDDPFDAIKIDKTVNESLVPKTQIVAPISMSPMHNQMQAQTNNTAMNDSVHSNNHSISSESSVIYRPTTEAHVDIYQMQSQLIPMASRKLENFNDPLLINGNKFNTISSKVNGMVQASIASTIFEEDKDLSNVVPMRSLIRVGYNSCTTSPLRTNLIGNGFFDDNGQGYCSDGDALRKASIRYSDIENGYLSDGSHFLSILRNNRPQMPSTIAEERWVNADKFLWVIKIMICCLAWGQKIAERNKKVYWTKFSFADFRLKTFLSKNKCPWKVSRCRDIIKSAPCIKLSPAHLWLCTRARKICSFSSSNINQILFQHERSERTFSWFIHSRMNFKVEKGNYFWTCSSVLVESNLITLSTLRWSLVYLFYDAWKIDEIDKVITWAILSFFRIIFSCLYDKF